MTKRTIDAEGYSLVREPGMILRSGKMLTWERRELLLKNVQISLVQGIVPDKDVHRTEDELATEWVAGATKASDLTHAQTIELLEALLITPPEGQTPAPPLNPNQVRLKVVDGLTGITIGEGLAEKTGCRWRIKYQFLEPEDPFDASSYGIHQVRIITLTGDVVMQDKVKIEPNDNIRPAKNYKFYDAMDNTLLNGVQCKVSSIMTAGGAFPTGLPNGPAMLTVSLDGYERHSQKLLVLDGYHKKVAFENVFLRRIMTTESLSATLRWGEYPRDLDLHCVSSDGLHVCCSKKTDGELELDIDAREGYGPETVTVKPQKDKSYHVYIKNYSDEPGHEADIANSGATVELRMKSASDAPAEVLRVSVPTNPTLRRRFWEVVTIYVDAKGKLTFHEINQLVVDEPKVPTPTPIECTTVPSASPNAAKKPKPTRFVAERIENGKPIKITEPPALEALENLYSHPQQYPNGVRYQITVKPFQGSISAPKQAEQRTYLATVDSSTGIFSQRNVTAGGAGRVLQLKLHME